MPDTRIFWPHTGQIHRTRAIPCSQYGKLNTWQNQIETRLSQRRPRAKITSDRFDWTLNLIASRLLAAYFHGNLEIPIDRKLYNLNSVLAARDKHDPRYPAGMRAPAWNNREEFTRRTRERGNQPVIRKNEEVVAGLSLRPKGRLCR